MIDTTYMPMALWMLLVLYIMLMTALGIARIGDVISGENHFDPPLERALAIADMLQHVDKPKDERCPICHDDEPTEPVRLSCKHLFCCSCAYTMLLQRYDCPLCLRKPEPLREHLFAQSALSAAIDAQVRLEILFYTVSVLPAVLLFQFGDNILFVQHWLYLQCLVWMLYILTSAVTFIIRWPRNTITPLIGRN